MSNSKTRNAVAFTATVFFVLFAIVPPILLSHSAEVAVSEIAPAPQDAPAPAKEEIKQPLPKTGNVTVNFKDVDIKTVLHYLSEMSGVDIIPSPGVDAMVTMRLRDKPWETALDIVTRNYGYTYSREGDIIRVIPKGQLHAEEPTTEVIKLNYIIQSTAVATMGEDATRGATATVGTNITKLMEAVESVIVKDSGEKATFLPDANAIVVTAIPARIGAIKELISKIDKKTPQIMLEAKVVEVTLDRNDQFGVDWNAVVTAAGAKKPTTFPFANTGNFPFLSADQAQFNPLGDNRNVSQVFPQGHTDGSTMFPFVDDAVPTGLALGDIYTYGTLDFSTFQAVLRMIDEKDDTNIISSPRITTLNNHGAVIKVVTNVYLQKQQKTTDTATLVTVEFEETPREVGVLLAVIPHINEDGEITLDLYPQVSSNLTFDELQVNNVQNTISMQYRLRSAMTQVMIKDGETIFIGGLISETTTKEDHKFPILGDLLGWIPVAGSAFKYEQDNVDKTEVVFFVTVHVIKDAMDSIHKAKEDVRYEKCYPKDPEIKKGQISIEAKKEDVYVKTTGQSATKPFLDFRKKK